jgi:predicted MFS family arabinose efflux permease
VVPSVGGPAFFLIQGAQLGWLDPLVLGALVAGLVAAVGFVWWQRRAPAPLLPLGLFRARRFTVLNLVTFILYGALISCGTYTVVFLQDSLGYHPAVAGVVASVPIMLLFVLSGWFGGLADRFGGRWFIGGGAAVAGLGMLLLLRVEAGADLVTVVLPAVVVHGLGLAMLVAPLTSGVMSAVPADRAGVASGVNNAIARTGSMVAIAAVGVLISLQFSASLDRGAQATPLTPALQRAVQQAHERPLAATLAGSFTSDERARIEPILSAASVDAFRLAVGVTGALALAASAITLAAGRERSDPAYDAAGTLGCPVTGARTHRDAAPIGSRAPA